MEREDTYSRSERANEEIDDSKVDTFAPFLPEPTPPDRKPYYLDQITVEGDEELQLAIRELCREFEHILNDNMIDLDRSIIIPYPEREDIDKSTH